MIRMIAIGELSQAKEDWESKLPPDEYAKTFMRNSFFTLFMYTVFAALLATGVLWCFTFVILAFEVFNAVQVWGIAKAYGLSKAKTLIYMIPVNGAIFTVFFVARTLIVGYLKTSGKI